LHGAQTLVDELDPCVHERLLNLFVDQICIRKKTCSALHGAQTLVDELDLCVHKRLLNLFVDQICIHRKTGRASHGAQALVDELDLRVHITKRKEKLRRQQNTPCID
jgi:hypothetical protein